MDRGRSRPLGQESGGGANADIVTARGARIGNLFVLSPDGTCLIYVGNPDGKNQLYVWRLDQFDATAIGGTEDAIQPFFSPDGNSVGFFARGKLKKVALAGGAPITLADAPISFGGTWAPDDTIVFAPWPTGPTTLPGGKAVLYTDTLSGALVYLPNTSVSLRKLVWVDRLGRTSPAMPQTMAFGTPSLAPDGQRFRMVKSDSPSAPRQLRLVTNWIEDIRRAVRQ